MPEDEETATARYIASNVSTQLMLKALFELIGTMMEDPDGCRSDIRKQLLEVADTMPLAPMAAAREKRVRTFVKETVGDLLINKRTNQVVSAAQVNLVSRAVPALSDVPASCSQDGGHADADSTATRASFAPPSSPISKAIHLSL
jgi:hypothetical protein